MSKRTRLYFKSVLEIVGGEGIGVVTLTDIDEQRALTFVCDHAMIYQLSLRNSEADARSKLLPEVLVAVLEGYSSMKNFDMNIYALAGGEYKVMLYNLETLRVNPIRLSDAVLLTRLCDIPLSIDNTLFDRQGTPYAGMSNRMAIPINSLPTNKLQDELDKAIETEDYRLAAILKDEISKRKAEDSIDDVKE